MDCDPPLGDRVSGAGAGDAVGQYIDKRIPYEPTVRTSGTIPRLSDSK